jgi:hypothetical protein
MTNETQQQALNQLNSAMDGFETYLNGQGDSPTSLRANWIYLQIFSVYDLRLPNTSAALETTLQIDSSQAASFSWFNAMIDAYNGLNRACAYFFNPLFNNMTTLGTDLANFAQNYNGPASVFGAILSMIKTIEGRHRKSHHHSKRLEQRQRRPDLHFRPDQILPHLRQQ